MIKDKEPVRTWLNTPVGRFIRLFGGIRFAIPVLVLVAAGLAWGTWIDSTQGAQAAARLVYGAPWFVVLMGLVCISLVFSVATRFPWRRRHVGFITVHASLILMIASGFGSFFTKVEGEIVLQEGTSADRLRTRDQCVELLSRVDGQLVVKQTTTVGGDGVVPVGPVVLRVLERWANSTSEIVVNNEGANPLHAVEVAFVPSNAAQFPREGTWIGQLGRGETPPVLEGLAVRVLPEGETWEPADAGAETVDTGPARLVIKDASGVHHDLPEPGGLIHGTSWRVESIENFKHAMIGTDGLAEGDPGRANPATRVVLVSEAGQREQHILFHQFADAPHKKMLDGGDHSPLTLSMVGGSRPGRGFDKPTIAFMRDSGTLSARFAAPGMTSMDFEHTGGFPWEINLQGFRAVVFNDYDHASGANRLVEAPEADENRPAIIVEFDDAGTTRSATLLWGQAVPVEAGGKIETLRFGPKTIPVPFSIALVDFRKMDYPGSSMAMAYESDVAFTASAGGASAEPLNITISMNKPLEHEGWKVYQSGFVGDNVSVFSVAKDPGLMPMYIGCVGLCLGILITFYSGTLSSGHPGIPTPLDHGQQGGTDADRGNNEASDLDNVGAARACGDGGKGSRVDLGSGANSGPGPRADHAAGHIREADSDRPDGAHQVVG